MTLNGDKTFDLSHTYADDGDYRVTVSVRDDDMVDPEWWVESFFDVFVANVPPTVDAGADAAVDEGSLFGRSGSFTDPGADAWTARVDYGDGSGVQPLTLNGDKTFDLSHTYADDGDYRVTVSVRDDDMVDPEWWVESFFDVFVANVPPTVDAGADVAVDEGSLFSRSGSFIDPGADSWTARVDYGDGSGVQPLTLNGDKTFDLSHTYADDGDYRVTVSVRDDDMVDPEWWVDSFFDVFVGNVAPTVDAGADATVDEGSLFGRSGSFTDPGADSWTARVDYGDGSGVQPLTLNGDKTFDLSHTYADDGDYRVTVSVRDDDMVDPEWWVDSFFDVFVGNVAPTVDAGADATVDEGSLFGRSGSFTDPGADSWTARVDYGDGSGVQPLTLNGDKTFDLSHTYADDGDYRVTVSVRDDDMVDPDWWVESFFDVFVSNMAPELAPIGNQSVDEQTELEFVATASDVPSDTLTFSLDVAAIALGMSITADGAFSWTPTEAQAGSSYQATITVTDDGVPSPQ